jgi:hypothetical protein
MPDPPVSSGRLRSWALGGYALLVGMGFALGMLQVCRRINPFDEAIFLVGSDRILNGDVPFRDFYALYPPGQYYVVAGLLSVFGRSVLTVRVYCVVVRALIALLLFLLSRRLVSLRLALAGWGACILWLSGYRNFGYPVFPALALALLGLILLATCVEQERSEANVSKRRLWGAGAAMGAAALFRQDFGVYAVIASLPWLAALVLPHRDVATSAGVGQSPAAKRPPVWAYPAGMAVAFGVPAAWLLAVVPVRELVFELFSYPATTYPLVRGLPYPLLLPYGIGGKVLCDPRLFLANIASLPFFAPLGFYALGLLWCVARIHARGRAALFESQSLTMLTLVILGSLAFNPARVRSDPSHAAAMLVLSYPVAIALMSWAWQSGRRWRFPAAAALGFVTLLTLPVPIATLLGAVQANLAGTSIFAGARRSPDAGADREAAAAYLRSVVPPGGRIFVGCSRHDMIFANEPILYFLSQRLPGTRYHLLDPGVATTLPVQREIVDELVRNRVEYVVLSTEFANVREPNLGGVSSGVTVLDEFLGTHYELDRRFGNDLSVWRKREADQGGPLLR